MPIKYKEQYLCDLDRQAFLNFFVAQGLGSGAAKELFQTLYQRPLLDLKASFIANKKLDAKQLDVSLSAYTSHPSADNSTKYSIDLNKNSAIETVRIPIQNKNRERVTVCVSSQVGCALDCSFCVTGTLGLTRNLKTWEIIEQVVLLNHLHPAQPINNVVFMGMGEPFYNYEAVKKATEILSDDCGLKIARKHITVSTAGVAPRILDWAKEGQTHLAVSLIAANDAKRSQLMSINERHALDELLNSMAYYSAHTGKKVLCEYILMAGLTDTQADIDGLVKILAGKPVKLNLIPYNENEDLPYTRPSQEKVLDFQAQLKNNGIFTTIRWSHGLDVNAACGQLRAQSDV